VQIRLPETVGHAFEIPRGPGFHLEAGQKTLRLGVPVVGHGFGADGEIGALDALPAVVDAAGPLPVLFDSGIRTGADIFKSLSLGARAVCIGRPYVYGLAIAGKDGVADVIRNLLAEFDLTMGLAGCRSVAELTRERLQPI
jgi:lactate 2-monooxygenase